MENNIDQIFWIELKTTINDLNKFTNSEDYRLEIHLHVINISDKDQTVATGQKLIQFVLIPVCYFDVEEVDNIENNTERKGGFGSTGL